MCLKAFDISSLWNTTHRNCMQQLGIHQLRMTWEERTEAERCQSSHSGEALGLGWGRGRQP